MFPAFGKGKFRAGREIAHRTCRKDLARSGEAGHPGGDVHTDAADIFPPALDFTGVDPSPDPETELDRGCLDRRGQPHARSIRRCR